MEEQLRADSTSEGGPFFMNEKDYTMVDIFFYPHLARLFYLEKSMLHSIYEELDFDSLPLLKKWFHAMNTHSDFVKDPSAQFPLHELQYAQF
mmetsp:Transcript_31579/g.48274  ORF Transcript_31579/g.48274 Transcript_31579/m.48274 type:complete len:92 (+) Transcript_31579:606-881(+)